MSAYIQTASRPSLRGSVLRFARLTHRAFLGPILVHLAKKVLLFFHSTYLRQSSNAACTIEADSAAAAALTCLSAPFDLKSVDIISD